MRLAFSTLGCPTWSLDRIARAAGEYGYAGVEIRGVGADVDLRESPLFRTAALPGVRRLFEDAGLSICCLGSSASFAAPERFAPSLEEARAYVEMAAALGCPLVRVFGGSPHPDDSESAEARVAGALRELAPFAADHGVTLVLETHDAFSTGGRVAGVLRAVDHPAAAALWDLHHPYREGEPPDATYAALAPYLRHTHVKDSLDGAYCLLGEGNVPVRAMVDLLRGPAADLWLTLEWEKRWHPEIAEPEVAFPQYARVLARYLESTP